MTITKDASAPLFVVVGSSGNQGGSVVAALQASSRPYRVRAIMRDTSKRAAKDLEALGAETRAADVQTVEGAKHAFEGATLAFCNTLTETTLENAADAEFAHGKTQIDAVKAAGLQAIAWAGELDLTKQSGINVQFFTGKTRVTEYARSLGLKVHDVQAPSFATNYLLYTPPRKQEDGSFVLGLPFSPDTPVPISDIKHDFGKYVVAAVEQDLDTVYAAPEYLTASQIAAEFAKVSGKPIAYQQVPFDVLKAILEQFGSSITANHTIDMYRGVEAVGYFGGGNKKVDLTESNKYLSSPARTFAQFLAANQAVVNQLLA